MISSGFERCDQRTAKKIRSGDDAFPRFADNINLRSAGHDNCRQFGRGIGMRNATADGAAVANLIMRNVPDGGHQQGMRRKQPRIVENFAPAHHGAERDAGIRNSDLP